MLEEARPLFYKKESLKWNCQKNSNNTKMSIKKQFFEIDEVQPDRVCNSNCNYTGMLMNVGCFNMNLPTCNIF